MRLESYEQTAALSDSALRGLVRGEGDPRERIWAAWSLGMRLGDGFARDATGVVDGEPNPGIRRHVIVMLAGFGERRIIEALARHDPDEFVRATAVENLLRTTSKHDRDAVDFALARLVEEQSDWVRGAIIAAVRRWPDDRVDLLQSLIADRSAGVRTAVVARLIEVRPLSALFPGVLEDRLRLESDARLRGRLLSLCRSAGRKEVAAEVLASTRPAASALAGAARCNLPMVID